MAEKKDRSRFSIKFNENDPAHETVICLLEKQGPHSKASFIVNAVLHYIHCSETPDIPHTPVGNQVPMTDRAAIEAIVSEILIQRGFTEVVSRQEVYAGGKDLKYAEMKATEQLKTETVEYVNTNISEDISMERKETELAAVQSHGDRNNAADNRMRDLIVNTMSAFRNG